MAKKKDNLEDLRARTDGELEKTVLDLKKQLMESRFQAVAGQLKDTDGRRRARRQIARVKTVMAEKASKGKKKEKDNA